MNRRNRCTANRPNAGASTGPKTVAGKARAAQNARTHGLSIPIASDGLLSQKTAFLVEKLGESGATPGVHGLLRCFVEAQLDLKRIRRARHELIANALADPDFETWQSLLRRSQLLHVLAKNPSAVTDEDLKQVSRPTLEGTAKYAAIISQLAKRLGAFDRYERRALSRRKSAVRTLDAAGYQWPTASEGDLLKLIES